MSYNEDYGRHNSIFTQSYRCYPASFIDKPQLEKGDKIIMPPSALDRLAFLHIEYPMLFELSNPSADRVTHCGVLEFVADEGLIYLPYWMMQNMLLQEGDIVQVKNASLSKGKFVKLQPHTKDFLDISNPKVVLETSLRSFSCLTTGDTIMVDYNNKRFFIDVVETKPSSAVSIIETDCEVDFAPPLDYKEPEKPSRPTPTKRSRPEVEEEPDKKVAKFNPFTGPGRRLNGKPSTTTDETAENPESSKTKATETPASTQCNKNEAPSSSTSSTRSCGKLVFGSRSDQPANGTPKSNQNVKKEEPPVKAEEPKFQAFTGKKYSLKS
ncbi:ubiquitin recognition factor in ER-associated degradation protein 1-like [Chenopodium quinoa]|uniref:Ubiquitin fusion degradaton protein n=1 Tax=Chenopodium quinoa TaxID=63459 RepID=A0A803LCF7_CHEQI|nr:ubiquitin recognition factor in ER-associated degradation protein 1-like [Chenopodium quinoa]